LKKFAIFLILAAVAATLWFYGRKPQLSEVPFAKVTRETLASTLPTNGKVEPLEWSTARAESAGIVDRVMAQLGQGVGQGAVIATLRFTGAQPILAAAEAQIAQAKAQLAEIERGGQNTALADIENALQLANFQKKEAQMELDIQVRLEKKKAATAADVVVARKKVSEAQIEIDAMTRKRKALIGVGDRSVAEAALQEGEAAAAAARKRLAQSEIHSPLSGTVYELPARPGAFVNAGDPIASVGRLDKLRVRVYVDEPELGRVAIGQPVAITWEALPGGAWRGVVDKLPAEVIALGTRQVGEVLCTIDNANRKLTPGSNVNAEIRTGVAENALAIPKEAIRREGGESAVFVLQGDRIAKRPVKIGVSSATRSQIVSGLNDGDSVALPVEQALQDGARVKPVRP
jgi:HlyD family secretion protein